MRVTSVRFRFAAGVAAALASVALAAGGAAGCHAGSPPAVADPPPSSVPSTPPPHAGSPPDAAVHAPPAASGAGIGQKCGDAIVCAPGLECASYRGIAGARGPLFQTCEQRCTDDSSCTDGRHCRMIADGPGRVCR